MTTSFSTDRPRQHHDRIIRLIATNSVALLALPKSSYRQRVSVTAYGDIRAKLIVCVGVRSLHIRLLNQMFPVRVNICSPSQVGRLSPDCH
jgi:hypothetical protein